MSADLRLSLAITPYEHVREVLDGTVPVAGVQFDVSSPLVEAIFERAAAGEFDACEMSLGAHAARVSRGDRTFVAVPVFPSRMFRQSSIYVPRESTLRDPALLRGSRIGVPAWSQTTAVYVRGWLDDEYGIGIGDVAWVTGGLDEPEAGRAQTGIPGVTLRHEAVQSLTRLLRDGDIDALISARDPGPSFRPLLDDARAAEVHFFRLTGVYPIMHVLVLRRTVVADHPHLPHMLTAAFCTALERVRERATDVVGSHYPFPWIAPAPSDPHFTYGVRHNEPTLAAFLRYAHRQSVTVRHLAIDDLFA